MDAPYLGRPGGTGVVRGIVSQLSHVAPVGVPVASRPDTDLPAGARHLVKAPRLDLPVCESPASVWAADGTPVKGEPRTRHTTVDSRRWQMGRSVSVFISTKPSGAGMGLAGQPHHVPDRHDKDAGAQDQFDDAAGHMFLASRSQIDAWYASGREKKAQWPIRRDGHPRILNRQ